MKYAAPWWLPGGNLQTIWPALYAKRFTSLAPRYRRERWTTPDQDFVDVDWLQDSQKDGVLMVLFHGLEGSSSSHYAQAFADYCRARGYAYAVPHFRGCSGELNAGPRAYHSGDHEEIGWILARMRQRHSGPIVVVGISLGGNALLRWTQEMGSEAARLVDAVASVCSPIDLAASGRALELAQARHAAGASDYLVVLDTERTRLDFESRCIELRVARATALAALHKALAGDFTIPAEAR